MMLPVILSLALALAACSGVEVKAHGEDEPKTQSTATTVQSFTTVDGADLMTKLDAAHARGRTGQTPY